MITRYIVENAAGTDTYEVTARQLNAIQRPLVLEGVDGDEAENTVTYWYRNAIAGVEV